MKYLIKVIKEPERKLFQTAGAGREDNLPAVSLLVFAEQKGDVFRAIFPVTIHHNDGVAVQCRTDVDQTDSNSSLVTQVSTKPKNTDAGEVPECHRQICARDGLC